MTFILIIALVLGLVFIGREKKTLSPLTIKTPADYAALLSDWMELLSADDRVWARGKRISWLPPQDFGGGACLMTGVIDLTGTDPELRAVIDREYAPTYFDGNCLVARMLVVAASDERLILGSIDDIVMENRIASLCADNHPAKDVYVQISSDSITPAIEKKDREKFEKIWNRYAEESAMLA